MSLRLAVNLLVSVWLALNTFDSIPTSGPYEYISPFQSAAVSLTNFDSSDDIRHHSWFAFIGEPAVLRLTFHAPYLLRDIREPSALARVDSESYLVNCAFLL